MHLVFVAERFDAYLLYRDMPRFNEAVRGHNWLEVRLRCSGLKEPGNSASGFGPTRAAPSGRDEALAKWESGAR